MLSFWPSLSLLVFFLVIFLECRAIAGRVTLPLGSFLTVFCYGAIGAPLLALLFQQIPIFSDAGANSADTVAWLAGPPIEELAKAAPVIVLAFLTREARRLSIADLTLVGFASGAGFGFVEGNLNALVSGALPAVQHLAGLGLQTQDGLVFFAGHPVSTALVGLAAGIGLRFLPLNVAYAWTPSAFVILWASFDHGLYNWKLLNADSTGALPDAHFVLECLHALTLKGQLATVLLPIGLIVAQFFEAYLCSKVVGVRRDLLLAREWRPWVINEWLVALLRAPLGRAVFGQTLAYFRLRRAFYLAALEARRDPKDPTLTRHARSLEDRLKRERSILFDPPTGTWLIPPVVLQTYATQWTWRTRWVLLFALLLLFLFMTPPSSLPDWLRQFLFGEIFAATAVVAGLAFAVWRIVLFTRAPAPDPLAAEGSAFTSFYTRQLLLGCSLLCGLFPTLALLFGWEALAPGAAFISGALPGWISHGGNLQTLLGLGAFGSAVASDPRPAGEAFRHEIAAGEERIRRLSWEVEDRTGAKDSASLGTAPPLQLDGFLDSMAKLDAERDAQARRQFALDECERQAGEATIRDPAPAVQAVKDEFDRLAGELLDAAAKELDAIASLEQAFGQRWSEVMQDLDAHDVLRRRLRTPLRHAWQAQNDIGWALRVVEATDEGLLPMQLTLLPELHALATSAQSARSDIVAAGVERIRAAAAEYGETDPLGFAGSDPAEDDEASLLAELAFAAPKVETPKAFGLRAPQPAEVLAPRVKDKIAAEVEPPQPPPPDKAQSGGQRYREALHQLLDATEADASYLETIRHLERSAETLRQPIEPEGAKPPSIDPVPDKPAEQREAIESCAQPVEEIPAVTPSSEHQGELDDLIDAIKRDSGYLAFAKDTPAAQGGDNRSQPHRADMPTPVVEAAHAAPKTPEAEEPSSAKADTADERPTASASEPEKTEETVSAHPAHPPESVIGAATDTQAEEQSGAEAVTQTAAMPVADPEVLQLADVNAALANEPQPPLDSETHPDVPASEPPHEGDARSETSETVEAEAPAATEPPGIKTAPEREEPAAEVPSSPIAALFQAITAHWTAEPTQSQLPLTAQAIPADIEHGTTSSIDDQAAPQPAEAESESRKPGDWLADLSSLKRDDLTVQGDDASLERIEWPALSKTPDDGAPAQKPDTAATNLELAEPAEAPSGEDSAPGTDDAAESATPDAAIPAVDPVPAIAPESGAADAVLVPSAGAAEDVAGAAPSAEALSGMRTTVTEEVSAQPAAAPDTVAKAAPAQAPKAEGAEDFASKADRLSDLLAKLEQAMRAKAAAPATPSAESDAPVADNAVPTTTPARVVEQSAPQTPASILATGVEPEVAGPERPVEQAQKVDQPPAPLAEVSAGTGALEAAKQPAPHGQDRAAEPSPASASSEPQEPVESQLKPDRLSYLLTKLFEAVKRQSAEQAVKPEQTGADPVLDEEIEPPIENTLEHGAAGEILDLRGPDPVPEPAEPSIPSETPPRQERAKPEERPDVPAMANEAAGPAVHLPPPESPQPSPPPHEPAPVADTGDTLTESRERQVAPRTTPRAAEPAAHFGLRRRPGAVEQPRIRDTAATRPPKRGAEPAEGEAPATTPRRDWKLGSGRAKDSMAPSQANGNAPELQIGDADKKSETTLRVKTGSGALVTVDTAPPGRFASAEKAPGKYYGPRHASAADDEPGASMPAQQRALSLVDALSEYYARTGEPQPPMYATDRATLQRIATQGKLEAPRRRGAPWSISGMSRRGEAVIRLKPGSEQFVEFVPSKEIFGQVPHYYPRGIGRGGFATHIPATHLEYFDVTTRQWTPVQGS